MTVEQLISPDVPVLSPADTGSKALALMEETRYHHLPVVDGEHYTALVQEDEMLGWAAPQQALDSSSYLNYKPAITLAGHPYDALRITHQMDLDILPVIDYDNRYIGAITKDTLLKYVAENSGIDAPGGIIVLEIAPRDYTLYEIARICENEDVVILNTQVRQDAATGIMEVTLKLNRTALNAVLSSLQRHKYTVKEVYGEDADDDDIAGKYRLLMNYINM